MKGGIFLYFIISPFNILFVFSCDSGDFRDPHFKEMLDLLAMLKKGYCDGMKVRIGRLQNLISSSCIGKGEQGLIEVTSDLFLSREMYICANIII